MNKFRGLQDRIIHKSHDTLRTIKLLTGKEKVNKRAYNYTALKNSFGLGEKLPSAAEQHNMQGSVGECLYNHPIRKGVTYQNAKGLIVVGNVEQPEIKTAR